MLLQPSVEELERHHVNKSVDRVSRDEETTAFKRLARLHQARWREAHNLPEGAQPMRPSRKCSQSPLGSRIDLEYALSSGSNFLTEAARKAAAWRVSHPEPKQTLDADRLYADLLSSMPMCFNLFGPLVANRDRASSTAASCWPDAPGKVREMHFEWSPGRQLPGRFLENRSAFDVAFELKLTDGSLGVIGVETKYHEDCRREKTPSKERLLRYRRVTAESGIFVPHALDALVGTHLQQIWLDHLLALSMLQDTPLQWTWVKFVLVHPAKNPSFARAAATYAALLTDSSTFECRTIESILERADLPAGDVMAFRDRYLW